MGPFRTNDLTGIDLSYDMMKETYEKTGEKPLMFDVIEDMVKKGWLGRKSGRGFYEYK
jgi:3-hydroxyacyl-CoA dehydrogenase